MMQQKYSKRKNFFLISAGASATIGAVFYFSANKQYNNYLNLIKGEDDEPIRRKVETYDLLWQSAAVVAIGSATMAIIYETKNKQAKKKINFSAIPVEGGGVLSIRLDF